MKIELSPEQRRTLRADAHHLDPVVMIGNDGLTPAVLHEIDVNLRAHGLIKIRVFSDEREARDALLARIADELDAAEIQHIGKLLVLWRPLPEPEKKLPGKTSRTGTDGTRTKTARQKLPAGRAPRGVPRAPGEARRTRAQSSVPGIPGRRRPRSQP